MFFQAEDPAVVKANAFKNSVAIKQTVIEHGNLGICLGIKLSIDKDHRFFHRRFYGSLCRGLSCPWFLYHRPASLSGFHNRDKNLGGSLRNSRGKVEESKS